MVTVRARVKPVITVDGLEFKDLNGNGHLDPYEDWRLPATERAADLVSRMTPEELAGLMVISSRPMGLIQKDPAKTSHDGVLDEEHYETHFFGSPGLEGTTEIITERHVRHFIVREYPRPSSLARWVNAMQELAEGTRLGIPVIVASNSRNEVGGMKMIPTSEDTDFTLFPGTLGLAAAADQELIRRFADIVRTEFDAANIRKGYMYMADVVTDPRWFRINGTFGEDPQFISDTISTIVRTLQGPELGLHSVACTIKHFPGGGARENGFDPHYAEGKFNIYPTPGSLEAYHLPPFRAAVAAGTSSVMPYYAIPSNEKSAMPQAPHEGDFEQVGFAFNKAIVTEMLREGLGHQGYVNSDSGVLAKMAWGVEELTVPQRVAKALEAGTDILADTNDVGSIIAAHAEGLVSTERLQLSARRLTEEMFQLGLFDDPYRSPEAAEALVACEAHRAVAAEAHRRSVVLLKNDGVLPLRPEARPTLYVEMFEKDLKVRDLDALRARIAAEYPEFAYTTDPHHADLAVIFVKPFTGSYFESAGLIDLNIVDGTGIDIEKVRTIAAAAPKTIVAVNIFLPWLLGNVELLADALVAGFETREEAVMDVVTGRFAPEGRLPITLPIDDAAIAVDDAGDCASPNDVPGYDKERYMDGRPYVYVDAAGNRYERGFGLTY